MRAREAWLALLFLFWTANYSCSAAINHVYEPISDSEYENDDKIPLLGSQQPNITVPRETKLQPETKIFQYENKKLDLYKTITLPIPQNTSLYLAFLRPIMLMTSTSHFSLRWAESKGFDPNQFLSLYFSQLQQIVSRLIEKRPNWNFKALASFNTATTNTEMLYYLVFILKCERKWSMMEKVGFSSTHYQIVMNNLIYNLIRLKQTELNSKKRFLNLLGTGGKGEKSFIIGRLILPQLQEILRNWNKYDTFSIVLKSLQNESNDFWFEGLKFPKEAKRLHKLFCQANRAGQPSGIGCECLESYVTRGYSCRCLGCDEPFSL